VEVPTPDALAAELRALADLSGPERAFLTLYVSGPEALDALAPRLREIRGVLAGHEVEREHFEENLALMRPLAEGHRWHEAPGLAVFTCWANDFARAVALPVAVEDGAWVGDAPYVRPLAELLDEHETFAVAVVDARAAEVHLVVAAEAEEAARIRGDVKNRVRKGGWSQKRYARRREKELGHYAADVAEALDALDRESPFARLVLLGADEAVRAVQDRLPRALADKLVGTRPLDAYATEEETLEAALDVAEEAERADERRLWDEIRESNLRGGLATVGATRVLAALEQARVEALLVDREAEIAGTKCRACEHLVHGTPQTCQQCGSADVFPVDLVEALVERAARTGADVDFADPFAALTEVGHVAALLRY
jgi:peptide subunit release factor 1 (eRF1)